MTDAMKNRFLPLLAGLLLATGVSAQPCLEVENPTNKVVEMGTPWDFDAPTILTNCCQGDAPITILATTTNGVNPQIFTRIWEITNLCADTVTCTQTVTLGHLSHDYNIWLYDTNSMPQARAEIEQRGGVVLNYSEYFERISFRCYATNFAEIAAFPFVRRSEAELEAALFNHNSRLAIGTINIQAPPYGSKLNGLTGAGVTAGVWDGGNSGLIHPDYFSRVIRMDACSGTSLEYDHASHVIGTMAGDGSSTPTTFAGMAPKANIRAWSFHGCVAPPQIEMQFERTAPPVGMPVIDLSQNSWGYTPSINLAEPCKVYGAYVGYCEEYDKLVRKQALPIFFAAGNAQNGRQWNPTNGFAGNICIAGGLGTVLPIGTAKNVVTVGAVDIFDRLTDFSSCGPTLDGRLKPDVVALGQDVFSTVGTSCGFKSGTSMATPAVSGTAALLIEQFRRSYSMDPSPALLKAILCNTATDLGTNGPDFRYGYGKVSAVKAVETIVNQQFQEEATGLNTGGSWTRQITATGGCELRITLAWTDREYIGADPGLLTLVNDLDLTVTEPNGTTVHLPLTLDYMNPTDPAVELVNHRDNVEQIVVANAAAGTWTIQVNGFGAPQGPQPFVVTWDFSCPVIACPSTSVHYIEGLTNSGEGIPKNGKASPPSNVPDPNFRLISSPTGTAFTFAHCAGFRDCVPDNGCNGWMLPGLDSNGDNSWWLHPGPSYVDNPNAFPEDFGDYVYETTFDLGCCDHTTAKLKFWYAVDDWGELALNGRPVPDGGSVGGFSTWTPVEIKSGFVPGINTLSFTVHNNGGAPTGLRVKWDQTNCTVCCPIGASITGQSFSDSNNNGLHDAGESGLPYRVVQLSNGQSAVTDENGYYAFHELNAGTYTVTETPQSGWMQTAPAGGSYVINLASSDCVRSNDFGSSLCALDCPSNIVVECTNESGYVVYYPADPQSGATYDPPSGWTFPMGTTHVTRTALDPCGNSNTCTFTVTVHRGGNFHGFWIKSSCNAYTRGQAIAVDKQGNSFVGGLFSGTTNFCGVTLRSYGRTNGFVAKYAPDGTFLWVRRVACPGTSSVNGVAVDSQGNCYAVGSFTGATVSFPDANPLQLSITTPQIGGSDIFLAKYDPNGAVLWSQVAGGINGDNGEGVAVDDENNCYITGAFTKTATFGNGVEAVRLAESGVTDCYLAKCNPSGAFLWAIASSHIDGKDGLFGADSHSVAIDNRRKKAFITGFYYSDQLAATIYINRSLRPTHYGSNDPTLGRGFVAQVDLSPAPPSTPPKWVWAREAYCPVGNGRSCDITSIGVDNNTGNCFFTGYFQGNTAIGPLPSQQVANSSSQYYNNMVGSFATDGEPRWLLNIGASQDDEPRGLAVNQGSGEVYVTGFRFGANTSADGGQDVKLLKVNSDGSGWDTEQFGTGHIGRDNAGRAVTVGSDGCVYVTGSYNDWGLSFTNFLDGNHNLSASSATKLFIAKYCAVCSTNCDPAVMIEPLLNKPRSTAASITEPIVLQVKVSGTPPFSFVWYRNGVPLLDPSDPNDPSYSISHPDDYTSVLTLTAPPPGQTFDLSTYTGIVSSQCCTCPPAVSSASIVYAAAAVKAGTGHFPHDLPALYLPFQFFAAARSNLVFSIEYRDDLNPGTPWLFLTNMVGNGTNSVPIDPNPNPLMRFYRFPTPPDP